MGRIRSRYHYVWTLTIAAVFAALRGVAGEVRLPDGSTIERVDFDRHVVSLLGRLGCNAGSCHGSFQGKGGLALSLFGHAPEQDARALVRDALGRRVNRIDPDASLVLLKPTGQVAHEGGRRFAPGSWEYQVLRAWISQGAGREPAGGGVRRIEVVPAEHAFDGPGRRVQLTVRAEFEDGTRAAITPFCEFRVKDDAVASVSPTGELRGLGPGATAVVVSYRGQFAAARVLVPVPFQDGDDTHTAGDDGANNLVDRHVFDRLRQLRLTPSGPSTDAEFLRRVTIDAIGDLPAPDDVRAFLSDADPLKRARRVEMLLAHPRHAALWATRFCDLTACNVDAMEGPRPLRSKRAAAWHDWFRRRFAENRPYLEIVRGVLCANSRDGRCVDAWIDEELARHDAWRAGFDDGYAGRRSLDLFWRREENGEFASTETLAELSASAFLGVRIECARCHKHPFDRWTLADYRSFANVFARVAFDLSPEARSALTHRLEDRRRASPDGALPPFPRLREVYNADRPRRLLADPATNGPLSPKALGGPLLDGPGDPRAALFDWLARPDNSWLSRAFVNRAWAVYFGAGLVEPLDGFSEANPPANAPLLDALARDFVASGYDVRRLERLILNSRTYQLSSTPVPGNLADRGSHARSYPRRLLAEVFLDVLNTALGTWDDYGPDARPGARAVEVAPNRLGDPDRERPLRLFGRPPRASTCDCERPRAPVVAQTLYLMSDPALLAKLSGGRLAGLLAGDLTDEDVIEELFFATLSRPPTAEEQQAALDHLEPCSSRRSAFEGLLWALINTREFTLNH